MLRAGQAEVSNQRRSGRFLEELEGDLRLLSVALARTVTDSGRWYSLEEVAAELGVDLDALADEDWAERGMAKVWLTEDAREDLRDLDGAARVIVLTDLKKLQTEPEKRGSVLGSKLSGNLTTFRKMMVGDRNCRIVYRVDPDGSVVVV